MEKEKPSIRAKFYMKGVNKMTDKIDPTLMILLREWGVGNVPTGLVEACKSVLHAVQHGGCADEDQMLKLSQAVQEWEGK